MSSEKITKNSEKTTKIEVEQLEAESSRELDDSQLEEVAGGSESMLQERHAEGGGR